MALNECPMEEVSAPVNRLVGHARRGALRSLGRLDRMVGDMMSPEDIFQ